MKINVVIDKHLRTHLLHNMVHYHAMSIVYFIQHYELETTALRAQLKPVVAKIKQEGLPTHIVFDYADWSGLATENLLSCSTFYHPAISEVVWKAVYDSAIYKWEAAERKALLLEYVDLEENLPF